MSTFLLIPGVNIKYFIVHNIIYTVGRYPDENMRVGTRRNPPPAVAARDRGSVSAASHRFPKRPTYTARTMLTYCLFRIIFVVVLTFFFLFFFSWKCHEV